MSENAEKFEKLTISNDFTASRREVGISSYILKYRAMQRNDREATGN